MAAPQLHVVIPDSIRVALLAQDTGQAVLRDGALLQVHIDNILPPLKHGMFDWAELLVPALSALSAALFTGWWTLRVSLDTQRRSEQATRADRVGRVTAGVQGLLNGVRVVNRRLQAALRAEPVREADLAELERAQAGYELVRGDVYLLENAERATAVEALTHRLSTWIKDSRNFERQAEREAKALREMKRRVPPGYPAKPSLEQQLESRAKRAEQFKLLRNVGIEQLEEIAREAERIEHEVLGPTPVPDARQSDKAGPS